MCLNGNASFKINASVSFYVVCETLEEVDQYWESLKTGGTELMPLDQYPWSKKYAWVQDRFGVSWQLFFGRIEDVGQKFTPSLMFARSRQGKAEEAISFYTDIFKPSSVPGIMRYEAGDGDVEGTVKHAQFRLGDNVMMAMDSVISQGFEFNEGISLVVECSHQMEIDFYWEKLTKGGSESNYGWLKDRFGLSWQIVPSILGQLMSEPERSQRVIAAFTQMKKIEIAKLLEA